MKDFRSFIRDSEQAPPPSQPMGAQTTPPPASHATASTEAERLAAEYMNKSQGELEAELNARIRDIQGQGGLDTQEIERMYGMLSPMLNAEQRTRLDEIIGKLKP